DVSEPKPRTPMYRHLLDWPASRLDTARVKCRKAHDGREQGRLAHAIASQDRERSALLQDQAHIFEHDGGPVTRTYALELERFRHGAPRGKPGAPGDRRQFLPSCLRTRLRPAQAL